MQFELQSSQFISMLADMLDDIDLSSFKLQDYYLNNNLSLGTSDLSYVRERNLMLPKKHYNNDELRN